MQDQHQLDAYLALCREIYEQMLRDNFWLWIEDLEEYQKKKP